MDNTRARYHYRDQDEIDIVVVDHVGAVVDIEVKAGFPVPTGDFKGLLAEFKQLCCHLYLSSPLHRLLSADMQPVRGGCELGDCLPRLTCA